MRLSAPLNVLGKLMCVSVEVSVVTKLSVKMQMKTMKVLVKTLFFVCIHETKSVGQVDDRNNTVSKVLI